MAAVRLTTALSAAMLATGCLSEPAKRSAPVTKAQQPFVPASPELLDKCRTTARALDYPVPCPTRILAGLVSDGGLDIIGAGKHPSWRDWLVGSSSTDGQHLVVTGSPRPVQANAKVVNGPAWYQGAQVRLLGSMTIGGRRMNAVLVPAQTNAGSAFANHVAFIWTEAGHTYAFGFHNVRGVRQTVDLNAALAEGLRLVGPNTDRAPR
jgi:hypothetical protein